MTFTQRSDDHPSEPPSLYTTSTPALSIANLLQVVQTVTDADGDADGDADTDADYVVIEMARHMLGPDWLADYVRRANTGGIERVLV